MIDIKAATQRRGSAYSAFPLSGSQLSIENAAAEGKSRLPLSRCHIQGAHLWGTLANKAFIQAQTADNMTSPQQHLANPASNGYFYPTPPAAAYQGHLPSPPPPGYPHQPPSQPPVFPNLSPHPAMHYAPHPTPAAPPQQVFLGFLNKNHTSVPVYGPLGAKFDWIGNVWVELPDGTKDWIGPYHNAFGYPIKNPRQRAEEDCCWVKFGMFHDDLYWK